MNDLGKIHDEIYSVNSELLKLISRLTMLFIEINNLKNKNETEHTEINFKEMTRNIIKCNQGNIPDELLEKIFTTIFESTLCNLRKNYERELLVNSKHTNHFKKINEMFNLSSDLPTIIAGPCAIESDVYLDDVAKVLKRYNIGFLRGGAYKPRTSPYDFQGLKEEGLRILNKVSKLYSLISVSEVVDTRDVELMAEYIDILQVGARNMQNYELLKEIGKSGRPVILKRGISASIHEFIYAAEYIALQGNRNIILCERGIRTFETKTRNTLDISSIPIIKSETNLPIIVDLSHSLGRKDIINPIAKSVLAAGADGIMVEVHPKPGLALSDSKQQLNIEEFISLLDNLNTQVSHCNFANFPLK